jgi:hypothetical protein
MGPSREGKVSLSIYLVPSIGYIMEPKTGKVQILKELLSIGVKDSVSS